jgi:hypothetical protein
MADPLSNFPGADLRAASLGVRDLDTDLAKMIGENPAAKAAAVANRQAGTDPALPTGRVAGVLEKALQYRAARTPNASFYSPDPANACASFVSAVLVEAGVFAGPIPSPSGSPAPGSEFTRSANTLLATLQAKRAIPVVQRASVRDTAALSRLAPGDLIFWSDGNAPYHHSGVFSGEGRVVSISSGAGTVSQYKLADAGYTHFTAYRLP